MNARSLAALAKRYEREWIARAIDPEAPPALRARFEAYRRAQVEAHAPELLEDLGASPDLGDLHER